MNGGFSLLLLLAQAAPAPAAPVSPPIPVRTVPTPPADWSRLAELPLLRGPQPTAVLSDFVRAEVAAGRCDAAVHSASGYSLKLDLAVLVSAQGQIRRIVPRAIDCVTVEQYGSGLISRLARDNIDMGGLEADTWFRTSLVFAWGT